jgi:hypothetical protein
MMDVETIQVPALAHRSLPPGHSAFDIYSTSAVRVR